MTRDQIIEANPIVDYVRNRGHSLARAGENFVTSGCPVTQHKRSHRPVMIYPQTQSWNCHDCKIGGTVIDWVMREKGLSAGEAMQLLGGGRNGDVKKSQRQICATYDYHDASGKVVHQTVRYDKPEKDFSQRHPDGKGGWIWNLDGVDCVLFRLPELMQDIRRGLPIFLCEGEKDVLAMVQHGFAATTNPLGAKKWRDSYSETLRGADLIIVADKDAKGRDHAQTVASKLHGIARFIRVIELPDVNGTAVKDPADFFSAGGTADQLRELVDNAPDWTPRAAIQDQTSAIRGQILSILMDGKLSAPEHRAKIANAVAEAFSQRGRFFFHAARQDFDSAMFFDNERKRLERIRSDSFLAWLAEWVCVNRADPIFKFIAAQIETVALAGKQTVGIIPESFWAARKDAIYLSNGDGGMARITAGKVDLVDNGTDGILFSAGNTLAPWALVDDPRDPFSTCSLFSGANCTAKHGPDLLRAWILSLPTNPPSKPPLCLAGDVGSGKTRLAKGIAELYGLPFVANNVEFFGEDSFWTSLDGGGLFTLDNADTRNRWLSDAVASAATDGCSQRRKLYTNSEKVTLRAHAWICLTTANPTFASDAGLADRLLVIRMNRRTDETSDSVLSDEIREHRDSSLSFIAHTLSVALADQQSTPSRLNQRHPDFAAHAVRIGRTIGRETETIAALKIAEADKSLFCLENDTLGSALIAFMQDEKRWDGTAAELFEALKEIDTDIAATKKDGKPMWSAKRLGKRIAMLWPHLEKAFKAKQETGRGRIITYTFKNHQNGEFGEF
jgi:CHC2-type zinc finger protein/Toprim domain-containing protein